MQHLLRLLGVLDIHALDLGVRGNPESSVLGSHLGAPWMVFQLSLSLIPGTQYMNKEAILEVDASSSLSFDSFPATGVQTAWIRDRLSTLYTSQIPDPQMPWAF